MISNSAYIKTKQDLISQFRYSPSYHENELQEWIKKTFPKFKLTDQEIRIRTFLKKCRHDLIGSSDSNIEKGAGHLTLDPRVNVYRKLFENNVCEKSNVSEFFSVNSSIQELSSSFVIASPRQIVSPSGEGSNFSQLYSEHEHYSGLGSPEKIRAFNELEHNEFSEELTKQEILEKLEELYRYDPQQLRLFGNPLDEIILSSDPEIFAQCLQELFDKLKKENIRSLENFQKEFSLDDIEEYQEEESDLQRPKSHEISDDNRFDGISQLDIEIVDNNEIDNLSTTISFVSEVINQVKSVENK